MNRTQIDWFGFRSKAGAAPTIEALRGAFGSLGTYLNVRPRAGGILGYQQAGDLLVADMKVGLIAFGGEAQKGWTMVSVTGRGCEWVKDWDIAQASVAALPFYQMRRVDLALTTRDGSVTHDSVVAAYHAGQFTTRRPPNMKRIESEDPTQGRTVYVGSREESKFFRGYEKGYELARHYPKLHITHIDETPIEDIYRCEVECKPKHAPLPADLIDRSDQYFAGAYPFLQHLLVNVQPEIFMQVRERGPQRDLDAALEQVRHQYGSTLFTALAAYCGDITAVWDRIVGHKHNELLVDAGVLMVDHEASNEAQSPPAKPVLQ